MIRPLALALLACLLRPGAAAALDCTAAIAAMRPADLPGDVEESRLVGRWCALATLHDGLWFAAVLGQQQTITAAVLRPAEGGPQVVAGPVTRDTLDIDPPRSPSLRILLDHPAQPPFGFVVEHGNHYISTGRSAMSRTLYVFLRDEARLLAAFAGWAHVEQDWVVPCARRSVEGCRAGWRREYALGLVPRTSRGRLGTPDLIVRDRRGRVVSRHRWGGDAYAPATFDRTPPFFAG